MSPRALRWRALLCVAAPLNGGCGDPSTAGSEPETDATGETNCVEGEACTTACDTTGSLVCPEECTPPHESLNGQDDDCDGDIDEGLEPECEPSVVQPCLSFCATTGTKTCDPNGQWGPCEMEPAAREPQSKQSVP